jgi:hypothetical protein
MPLRFKNFPLAVRENGEIKSTWMCSWEAQAQISSMAILYAGRDPQFSEEVWKDSNLRKLASATIFDIHVQTRDQRRCRV